MTIDPARQGIQTGAEIQQGLAASLGAVADWFAAQSDADFGRGPEGRWTAGQHLDHLIRSVSPLNQGLALPRWLVGIVIGRSSRASSDYTTTATRYEGVLDAGGKAGGRFVPPHVAVSRKAKLIQKHRDATRRLITLVGRWEEKDLDAYAAKHPLLGQMTVRELLFFTIHHHDHHLQTLKRDYTA